MTTSAASATPEPSPVPAPTTVRPRASISFTMTRPFAPGRRSDARSSCCGGHRVSSAANTSRSASGASTPPMSAARRCPPVTSCRRRHRTWSVPPCAISSAKREEGSVALMTSAWPALAYEQWRATCDTLHAHTQVLGKLAVKLAPPEPELQHAALRLTARGWETLPLRAPDRSGSLVVALDLRNHEAVVEHSDGR